MEFYNPMAKKQANPNATVGSSLPGNTGIEGRSFIAGQGAPNAGQGFGRINVQGLEDPAWGTGITFATNAKMEAINAAKRGMSTANPEDYQGMDELRNYYRNYLSDLPGQTADKISSFDTQSQRGLSNLLSQYKNSNAGTGRIGSRQYGGAQGDIMSRAASDYTTGLINARSAAIDQANKVGAGLSGVQNQDMQERQFQADQSNRFSDMLTRMMAIEQGLPDVGADRAAKDKENTRQMITSGATLAGLALSDSRAKERARPAKAQEILKPFRKVQPFIYHYKDQSDGKGEQISPMAQDLLESEFSGSVEKLPDGMLAINYGSLLGRMFSAISEITKQLDHVKGELKAMREKK